MKITPEIEAVARAIYGHFPSHKFVHTPGIISQVPLTYDDCVDKNYIYEASIAAIRAMRELSTGMYCAGACVSLAALPLAANPDVIFTAMIDAALGDNK